MELVEDWGTGRGGLLRKKRARSPRAPSLNERSKMKRKEQFANAAPSPPPALSAEAQVPPWTHARARFSRHSRRSKASGPRSGVPAVCFFLGDFECFFLDSTRRTIARGGSFSYFLLLFSTFFSFFTPDQKQPSSSRRSSPPLPWPSARRPRSPRQLSQNQQQQRRQRPWRQLPRLAPAPPRPALPSSARAKGRHCSPTRGIRPAAPSSSAGPTREASRPAPPVSFSTLLAATATGR